MGERGHAASAGRAAGLSRERRVPACPRGLPVSPPGAPSMIRRIWYGYEYQIFTIMAGALFRR